MQEVHRGASQARSWRSGHTIGGQGDFSIYEMCPIQSDLRWMYIRAIRGWVGWDGRMDWDEINMCWQSCHRWRTRSKSQLRGFWWRDLSNVTSRNSSRGFVSFSSSPPAYLHAFPCITLQHNLFRFPYLLSAKSYRYESASQQQDEAYLSTFIGQTGPFYESDSTWGSSLMD